MAEARAKAAQETSEAQAKLDAARAETSAEVAEADAEAGKDINDANRQATEAEREANKDLADVQSDAFRKDAKARYDLAITQAEADHRVELEKCEAMPAEQQNACKDTADARLASAKSRAKQELDDAETATGH